MTDHRTDADLPTSIDTAIRVLRGHPTDTELAALVSVLGAAGDGSREAVDVAETSRWGQPADALRYSAVSWQQVTLLERSKMRRR